MNALRAWVRSLAGGRRRVVVRRPGAAMVLAIKPAARRLPRRPGIVLHHHRHDDHHHRHDDHHHRHDHLVHRVGPVPAVAAVRPGRESQIAAAVRGARSSTPAVRRQLVAIDDRSPLVGAPSVRGAAVAPTVRVAAVRAHAAAIGAAHRRVETFAPPPLTAAPVSPDRAAPRSLRAAPPSPLVPADAHLRAPVIARRPAMVMRPLAPAPQAAPAEPAARVVTAPRAAVAAPPELDLELLTERVVRQIDRRIVAHRERLGRI